MDSTALRASTKEGFETVCQRQYQHIRFMMNDVIAQLETARKWFGSNYANLCDPMILKILQNTRLPIDVWFAYLETQGYALFVRLLPYKTRDTTEVKQQVTLWLGFADSPPHAFYRRIDLAELPTILVTLSSRFVEKKEDFYINAK